MGGKMRRSIKKGIVMSSLACLLMASFATFTGNPVVEAKSSIDELMGHQNELGDLATQTDPTQQTTPTEPTQQTSPMNQTTQTLSTTEKLTETQSNTETTIEAVSTTATNESGDTTTKVSSEIEDVQYKDYETIKFEPVARNRIEQVQGDLPTIWTVFYYNGKNGELQSENPQNIRMMFNGNEWQASELRQWKKTEYGIHYYILLDTSSSVKDYFEELIDAINGLALQMEEQDTLTVYTVGNETDTLTPVVENATADDTVRIKEKLETLSADDECTYLNNAIVDIVQMIQTNNRKNVEDDFTGRDIVLVLSDGANDSNTGKTSEDVKAALKDSNIPVYAFINENAQATNGNTLEEIVASSSGRSIYVEDNDFPGSVDSQVKELQDAWIATFLNTDAIESLNYTIDLKLILDDSKEIWEYASKSAVFYRAKPDTEAPRVVSVVLAEDNCIYVTFSEFVIGADAVSAYKIEKIEHATSGYVSEEQSDTKLQVISVTEVGNHTDYTYCLMLNDVLYRGDYRFNFSNITDLKRNPLTPDYYETSFTDAPEKTVEKDSLFKQFWWIFLTAFLVLLVLILLIVSHIFKKNKDTVIVDDKEVLAGNTDVKQYTDLEQQQKGQAISLYLYSDGKIIKKIDAGVQGSMIVGRSDLCDIFIDDVNMSRQHFVIEFDGESFYIQDLYTTNGTMLNGVKMTHKRRLENNDRITAGSLDIVVRW